MTFWILLAVKCPLKILLKAVWPRNGHAASLGVKLQREESFVVKCRFFHRMNPG